MFILVDNIFISSDVLKALLEKLKNPYNDSDNLFTVRNVEIKNYKSELTDDKIEHFPHKIEVIYKEEMKEKYLPYVISKYGKNFISLYHKEE